GRPRDPPGARAGARRRAGARALAHLARRRGSPARTGGHPRPRGPGSPHVGHVANVARMANQPESGGPTWWRPSRDLALLAARSAHADASQAMVHLESLEVDLNELSAIDAAAAARRARTDPVGHRTPVADAWDELSVRTGIPALEFYELD